MPQQVHDRNSIPDAVVVVVCGTLVAQWYSGLVYGATAHYIHTQLGYEVRVLAIPQLGTGSIDAASESMAKQLRHEYPNPATRFIILGHSQGGSHAIALARLLGSRAIRPVIPLAAPHHGTMLASLGKNLGFLPAAFREMATHSEVLRRLRSAEQSAEGVAELEIVSIMTFFDIAVLPFSASLLKDAENIVLAPKVLHPLLRRLGLRRSKGVELVNGLVGHVGIVKHPAALHAIKERIEKLEAAEKARADEVVA